MMPLFAVLLLFCAAWFFWKAYQFARGTVKRWRGGLFRPSLLSAAMVVICFAMGVFLMFGAFIDYQTDEGYRRAGAADVEYLGHRPGFPNPLVAYTDRDSQNTCVAEVIGGEEYLNELVCLDPQE